MKKLFVFVILLLVVGVSSMAATFYHLEPERHPLFSPL